MELKEDELVVFAGVVYPSQQVRDDANQKMTTDERMHRVMADLPVDGRRVIHGRFHPLAGL